MELISGNRLRAHTTVMGLMAVLGTVAVVYRGAFGGFFVQDDFGWLESTRFSNVVEYLGCFFRFNPALSYRPLSQESFFWFGQTVFRMNPAGFHAMSLCFHLAGCVGIYLLLRTFFDVVPSLAGTLFYGSHGAHLRSVYWISAVAEPIALGFYVASIVLFIRSEHAKTGWLYTLSIVAMGLGVMSKESILTVPLVAAAYCLIFSRHRLIWTAPFFLISGIYTFLRFSSPVVRAAPYPLTFGREAWSNLQRYFCWSAGLSETLLKIRLGWSVEGSYSRITVLFLTVVIALLVAARQRRTAFWGILWFVIALQPVLYFRQHIDAYYLAPSLAGLSVLVAAAVPSGSAVRQWARWIPASLAVLFVIWSAQASVKLEGRWWNERTMIGRRIVSLMPGVEQQVPPGKIAYLFGFDNATLGVMQNDAALKAYGFSPSRFILIGLDPDTPAQIRHLAQYDGLKDYYCFVYTGTELVNMTAEFRRRPAHFLLPVKLEVTPQEIRRGCGRMILRVTNLPARAIDVQYTLDGSQMPPIEFWPLKPDGTAVLFVDESTRKGSYRVTAIRDADKRETWYPVDVRVNVR